jgi:hypothetical protein
MQLVLGVLPVSHKVFRDWCVPRSSVPVTVWHTCSAK